MCNVKFAFLLRGQLESLNLDRILLPLFKLLPCYKGFLVTYFLPLLLEYCAEIILIFTDYKYNSPELKELLNIKKILSVATVGDVSVTFIEILMF